MATAATAANDRPIAMTRRITAISLIATAGLVGFIAHFDATSSVARAQSADLVLCDRLAADPADPDKPADVRGVAQVASADVATALKFCRTAAGGSRRALYQLGRAYAANGQAAEAIAAFRKAADKGSSSSMVELGVAYATGTGVAKDDTAARNLFERAANAGNPRGISNLAALSGGGAPADPARARALLAKAAETNAEAQYQLGLLLAEGQGGPKDEVGARALFEKAAAQNHPGALERMGAFAMAGRGGPQDSAAAKAYYQRAAEAGNEEAKAALKRSECAYSVKDKRGNVVTTLCF
jgi:TPR repeat protein